MAGMTMPFARPQTRLRRGAGLGPPLARKVARSRVCVRPERVCGQRPCERHRGLGWSCEFDQKAISARTDFFPLDSLFQGLHQAGPCLSSNSVGDDGHIAGFADEQLGSGHAMSGDVRGAVVQDADGGAVFDSALKAVMRSRLDGYGSGYVECFVRHDFLPVNAPSLAHGLNHITSIKTSQALFSTFDCAEQQWRQA